jgi:hypothetical protein
VEPPPDAEDDLAVEVEGAEAEAPTPVIPEEQAA